MLRTNAALLLFLGGTAACGPSPAPIAASPYGSESARVADSIRSEDILARIHFLASDAMGGRGTPSPGLEAAAAYLASEHRRFGLDPAGTHGSYYQRYPFVPRASNFRQAPDASVPASDPSYPPNVVAVLPGSDTRLREEYVVLTAHFDHVGIGRPVNGDSIYNGADDNASGTAALLEIARALALLPERPARSILFLHVSGEEHGLLGSRWYSENPTVPIQQIVANINIDMIGRNAPDSIVVIGKSYSTLGSTVERAAAAHPELGLTVSDDLWPQERFFFRSDHYSFARLEIPALFFFAGVHEDYHQPSDHVELIDPDKVARVARLIFHAVQEITNDPQRPRWDPRGLAEVKSMVR